MYISYNDLDEMHACRDALTWFSKTFPILERVEITNQTLSFCQNDEWICWLACKKSSAYKSWCVDIAIREIEKNNDTDSSNRLRAFSALYSCFLSAASVNNSDSAIYAANAGAAYVWNDAVTYDRIRQAIFKELRTEAEKVLLAVE